MKCISSCSNCQISSVFFTLFVKHSYSMCQLNVKEDTWPKFDFTILAQLDHFHMLEQPTPFLDVLVVLLVDCCWLDLIVSNRLEPRETEPVDQMETNCVSSFARNRKYFSKNILLRRVEFGIWLSNTPENFEISRGKVE